MTQTLLISCNKKSGGTGADLSCMFLHMLSDLQLLAPLPLFLWGNPMLYEGLQPNSSTQSLVPSIIPKLRSACHTRKLTSLVAAKVKEQPRHRRELAFRDADTDKKQKIIFFLLFLHLLFKGCHSIDPSGLELTKSVCLCHLPGAEIKSL